MFDVNIIAINAYIPFTLNLFSPLALLTLFKSLLHSYQFYDWFCDHTFNFPRSHTIHAWGKFAISPYSNKQKYVGGFIGNILLILVISKDENIGNHGYIGTSILRIYRIYRRYFWIYRRYIGGYFRKKYWCLKLLKTHENVKKTS